MPLAFVVPGRFENRSGGSIYNRRIVEELRARGRDVRVVEVDGDADGALAGLPDGAVAVVDGLLFGTIPEIAARHAGRIALVALVHLPLAAEPGLASVDAAARRDSEIRALRAARHVVITGASTRNLLEGYGADDRLTLIEPGTDQPDADARATARDARARRVGPVRVLSVGTVNRGKRHANLLRALAHTGSAWQLTIAGSLTRYPAVVEALRAEADRLGCADRVTLRGDLPASELAAAYAGADLFALATARETYGMAVAEALAWELPVVSTNTGAIAELVGEAAGIVVPVGDDHALAGALARLINDATLRARLAAGARDAAKRLPSWHDQATAFAHVLDALA